MVTQAEQETAWREAWEKRFWPNVEFDTNGGCWLWSGTDDKKGYGIISVPYCNSNSQRAHRFAYRKFRGAIPHGLVTDHLCRVPGCVNPWHMEIVTPRENTLRGIGPTAINAQKTHCPSGHPYAGRNLMYRHGQRRCRMCLNKQEARRQRAKRAERRMEMI